MKVFFGFAMGWILSWWWFTPMYACETCDEIKRWAANEKFIISNEIYDLPPYSNSWYFSLGQERILYEFLEKFEDQPVN